MAKISAIQFTRSIKAKMIISFLMPVIFIITLGVLSYQKASTGLTERYEHSSRSAITLTQNYLQLILKEVSAKSVQIAGTGNIQKYYSGNYSKNPVEEYKSIDETRNILTSLVKSDEFLEDITIISEYGQSVTSQKLIAQNHYKSLSTSPDTKELNSSINGAWTGKHDFLDKQLKADPKGYFLTYITPLKSTTSKNIGYIIMDINAKKIEDTLKDMNLDKGSIIGLITNDNKEFIISDSSAQFSFMNQTFFQNIRKENTSYKPGDVKLSTILLNGVNYRYFYSYNPSNGLTLCTIIPENVIIKQAVDLRNITFLIVVIACIIAGLIGIKLSTGIAGTIKTVNRYLSDASEGNLTRNNTSIQRKDEFSLLAKGILNMIASMKNLINKMITVSSDVTSTSDQIITNASKLLTSTRNITDSIEDIRQGADQQAADAQNCLLKMESLSNQINTIQESSNHIKLTAADTKNTVTESILIIDNLSKKAQDTSDITQTILSDINDLKKRSLQITDFVNIINELSEQTNLLSLNASIEAARAGESGKGFAVIADSIRKLAEQSSNASNRINEIIQSIQLQTQRTTSSAMNAEAIVDSQKLALNTTIISFETINSKVNALSANVNTIIDKISEIELAKNETLEAVESISAVSQENAASTEVLSQTVSTQLEVANLLDEATRQLEINAKELNNSVQAFVI